MMFFLLNKVKNGPKRPYNNPKVYGDTAITDDLVFPKRAKNDVFLH